MRARHAAEIRRGISDAKSFVAKGRTISKGYVFFESSTGTLHGRSFQRALTRLSTRGIHRFQKSTDYTDGTTKYVNRLYSNAPSYIHPDWHRA